MMDYCAEPIWVNSEDFWANGDLDDLPISERLKKQLKVYGNLWELAHHSLDSEEMKHKTLEPVQKNLDVTAMLIALEIKRQLPDYKVHYYCETNGAHVEVHV